MRRKVFDHAFHFHESRSLYQHRRVGIQFVFQRILQILYLREMLRAAAEFTYRVHAQFAQRVQLFDAGTARFRADFGMKVRRLAAQFAHIAQHQDVLAGCLIAARIEDGFAL